MRTLTRSGIVKDFDFVVACKVCGAQAKRLRSVFGTKGTSEYIRCRGCSIAFAIKQVSSKTLSDYYDEYYTAENLEIPTFIRESISNTVHSFSKFRTEKNAFCDFGFGAGAFMEIAEEKGWKCSGSEYSPISIEIGKMKGWDVHQGDLGETDLSGPFDVITIVETLEHVQYPEALIQNAAARLRIGGLIYGTTPNGRSLNARILGENWSVFCFPEHPILLSEKSLRALLSSNGFAEIEVHSQGFNPLDMIRKIKQILYTGQDRKVDDKSRVQFGYELVALISENRFLFSLKTLINFFMSKLGIGDTLVFRAIRQ